MEYLKIFEELPVEEKALTILWWWNFKWDSSSPINPEISHEEISLNKSTSAQYECSISLEKYDVFGKGVIYYETNYNNLDDEYNIFITEVRIDEIFFFKEGLEIKLEKKEKIAELMSLCFVSGLEKSLDGYEAKTNKEYNRKRIKKKYSNLVLNTFPLLLFTNFINTFLGKETYKTIL